MILILREGNEHDFEILLYIIYVNSQIIFYTQFFSPTQRKAIEGSQKAFRMARRKNVKMKDHNLYLQCFALMKLVIYYQSYNTLGACNKPFHKKNIDLRFISFFYHLKSYKSLVLISEKERIFEIKNSQIFTQLLFYVAYKQHIIFRKKGISIKTI